MSLAIKDNEEVKITLEGIDEEVAKTELEAFMKETL